MRRYLALLFLAALASVPVYQFYRTQDQGVNMQLDYIVTESKGPDSFDPKDADKTQNLSVMRMLYATPLEITKDNLLASYVLSTFKYDEELKQISFVVREDLKYSDGTRLTAEDVALSIARAAYLRPEFPVIKEVKGVREWARAKAGIEVFPSGLTLKGNTIKIQLNRPMANPLFRFCLELFSIVPRRCFNLKTADLTCEIPPFSGYFEIQTKNPEKIVFKRRSQITNTVDDITPFSVTFLFQPLSEACHLNLKPHQIIAMSELEYHYSRCQDSVKDSQVHWMPSARFSVLRFNPQTDLFKKKEYRQYFSDIVRGILRKKNPNLLIGNSLFPKLMPGYLDSDHRQVQSQDLAPHFNGRKIKIPQVKAIGSFMFEALAEASSVLGMTVERTPESTASEMVDSFLTGEFPVIPGSSGFWAQDPVGDVSMWFTRNLHKTMSFVWDDRILYQQISDLEGETDPTKLKAKMENFNRYIVHQAVISPILHFRRGYITSSEVHGLNLPQAITSPTPWQLHVEK